MVKGVNAIFYNSLNQNKGLVRLNGSDWNSLLLQSFPNFKEKSCGVNMLALNKSCILNYLEQVSSATPLKSR